MTDTISIQATGLMYKNSERESPGILVQHPSLVPLDGDEMLATFDLDRQDRPLDYRTLAARSLDGGVTWALEGPLLRIPPPATTHSIRTARLSDGSVIGFGLNEPNRRPRGRRGEPGDFWPDSRRAVPGQV